MAPSSLVKVEIVRDDTGGTFTNYDILKGTVRLTVTGALSLNYIQVKLEGVSTSVLMIPKFKKGRREKDKPIQDQHRVLYDTVMVFPPKNIRDVSNAKEFTLTPGQYEYPFEFKMPLESSCVKMVGITNKVAFNSKSIIFNNNMSDNFNGPVKLGMSLMNNQIIESPNNVTSHNQQYHIVTQLPPSLSGMDEMASVKYFVKVTCKRSLLFSINLRALDPFIFLPLDMDSHNRPIIPGRSYEEYREVFVRKLTVFRERLPEIVGVRMQSKSSKSKAQQQQQQQHFTAARKPSFIQRLLGAYQYPFDATSSSSSSSSLSMSSSSPHHHQQHVGVEAKDVPFSFEARFRQPAFLIPNKPPSFRLYILSPYHPARYSLGQYGKPEESNGLGVIYLQSLVVTIVSETIASAVENSNGEPELHKCYKEEIIPVCHNSYMNMKFDLMNAKAPRNTATTTTTNTSTTTNNQDVKYELEIPRKLFANAVLPDFMAPSFKTCNITRRYHLRLSAGFSADKIDHHKDNNSNKIKLIDLEYQNIKILSGLFLSALNSKKNNSRTNSQLSIGQQNGSQTGGSQTGGSQSPPPPDLPTRPSPQLSNKSDTGELPTYSDVMKEQSLQNELEHMEARRRYQQHEQYYNNLE